MNHLGLASIVVLTGPLITGASGNLPCNCRLGLKCASNGYCRSGCAPGFYGAGCQISNIAYGRETHQVDTKDDHVAAFAVDGKYSTDPENTSIPYCSSTTHYTLGYPRWQVFFGWYKDYAVLNVTIINRPDFEANPLENFQILVGESGEVLQYGEGMFACFAPDRVIAAFNSTYPCRRNVYGKSVIIHGSSKSTLTLCEVIVYGYELMACKDGFTGPGCLLRGCNTQVCRMTGYCVESQWRYCHFRVCPEPALLPPDCWITITSFTSYTWTSTSRKHEIIITGVPSSRPNMLANFVVVNVATAGTHLDYTYESKSRFEESGKVTVQVFLEMVLKQVYDVRLTPKVCFQEKTCIAEYCYSDGDCFEGPSSEYIRLTQNNILNADGEGNGGRCGTARVFWLLMLLATSSSAFPVLNELP